MCSFTLDRAHIVRERERKKEKERERYFLIATMHNDNRYYNLCTLSQCRKHSQSQWLGIVYASCADNDYIIDTDVYTTQQQFFFLILLLIL